MTAIVNTKILLPDSIIWDGIVVFDAGVITAVGKKGEVEVPEGCDIVDAHGLYTAPGLVDIHNHGSEDDLFVDEPKKCCDYFIRHGQTTILPTFYCNLTTEQMLKGAEMIRAINKTGTGRVIDGLYLEGPYLSGGGSNQKYILWTGDILPEEYEPLFEGLSDLVRVWAIDPAREGIEGFMSYVHEKTPDAIFALGHSKATAPQCRKVQKYGVKVQTHFGCSGKAKGLAQGCIGPGCDEYDLANPDIYAEVIPDEVGVHLQSDMLRFCARTKGTERMIIITDSMASKEKFLNNEADGIAYGPDLNYDYEGHLAGSRLTQDNAVRNYMAHTGYGLVHAIRAATYNPACMLGIDDKVGSVEVGKKANLIIIDDTIRVKKVYLEGELAVEDGTVVMQ